MQRRSPTGQPYLSVVVPTYNETGRLEAPLRALAKHLCGLEHSAELVIVDDGSTDETFDRIVSLCPELKVPTLALRYEVNRGKGHALKVGFAEARGEVILFTDVDLATPIAELARLQAALDGDYPIVIGSRKAAGSMIDVHQPWYREKMGIVFTWLVSRFIADVSDATCGFKLFRGDVGRDLFSRLRIHDWAFDAELLFLARHRGIRVREVPVRWEDQAGTKVRLLRDAIGSLRGLLQIRLNHRRGLYEGPAPTDVSLRRWSSTSEVPELEAVGAPAR